MLLRPGNMIDLSVELDPKNFAMRTPTGFKEDMQFEMEVIKEHDALGRGKADRARSAACVPCFRQSGNLFGARAVKMRIGARKRLADHQGSHFWQTMSGRTR
jgi:hypothetical protein